MQTLIASPQLTVLLYDSIKDQPASLYQLSRQYEIMAAELGSNEAEQAEMLNKAEDYALTGKLPEFQEQMRNYRLARVLAKSRFQTGQLDWACRIHSVNGVPVTDYGEDALLTKIDEWSALGLTQQLIEDSLADVKKNALTN
ncbi:hypothetical protein [Spirosoma areae]